MRLREYLVALVQIPAVVIVLCLYALVIAAPLMFVGLIFLLLAKLLQ